MKYVAALAFLLLTSQMSQAAEETLRTPPLAGKPLICSLVNSTNEHISVISMRIRSISDGVELSSNMFCMGNQAELPDGAGCYVSKQASTGWGAWADWFPAYCEIVYNGPASGVLGSMQSYTNEGDNSAAVTAVRVTKTK